MGAALHSPLGQRSIDSRPASTCCTLGRGDVVAAVGVRPATRVRCEVPGPRVRLDSPEVTEGLQKTADRLLPLQSGPAGASERKERQRRGQGGETSTEWADEGSRRGCAERQTLGF